MQCIGIKFCSGNIILYLFAKRRAYYDPPRRTTATTAQTELVVVWLAGRSPPSKADRARGVPPHEVAGYARTFKGRGPTLSDDDYSTRSWLRLGAGHRAGIQNPPAGRLRGLSGEGAARHRREALVFPSARRPSSPTASGGRWARRRAARPHPSTIPATCAGRRVTGAPARTCGWRQLHEPWMPAAA